MPRKLRSSHLRLSHLPEDVHSKNKKLKCNKCERTFLRINHFNNHLQTHEKVNCKHCGKHFAKKFQLQLHLRVHSSKASQKSADCNTKEYRKKSNRKIHNCMYCDKKFSGNHSLKLHLRTHKDKITPSDNKILSPLKEETRSTNDSLDCNECGRKFSKKNYLTLHLKTHAKTRSCDKKFSGKNCLKLQKYRKKSKRKTHNCMHCDKKFSGNHSLKLHLHTHKDKIAPSDNKIVSPLKKETHSTNDFLDCNEFGRKFTKKNYLTLHLKTHTKKESCKSENSICQKFSELDSRSLNLSKLEEIQSKSKKALECNLCAKVFTMKNRLILHLLIHTGRLSFKSLFHKNPITKSSSIRHNEKIPQKINTEKKEYNNFWNLIQKSKLEFSSQLNSDEKSSNKCKICYKNFEKEANLRSHEKTHNSNQSDCNKENVIINSQLDQLDYEPESKRPKLVELTNKKAENENLNEMEMLMELKEKSPENDENRNSPWKKPITEKKELEMLMGIKENNPENKPNNTKLDQLDSESELSWPTLLKTTNEEAEDENLNEMEMLMELKEKSPEKDENGNNKPVIKNITTIHVKVQREDKNFKITQLNANKNINKIPPKEIQPSQKEYDQTLNCLIVFILKSWTPEVILVDRNGEFECGLVFKGTLNDEYGQIIQENYTTGIITKKHETNLLETDDREFIILSGECDNSRNNLQSELLDECKYGCPSNIPAFILEWLKFNKLYVVA